MRSTLLKNYVKMILLMGLIMSSVSVYAQKSKKQEQIDKVNEIKEIVKSGDFIFKAQFALPMGGNTLQLTSEYDVTVNKDSVVSFLPYFGRAYSAPLNPSDGGIRFKSKDFDYSVNQKKKGGWDIVLKPNDVGNIQQLTFYVSESGYATLQVIDNNRQPISFNGYIDRNKPHEDDKED